MNCYNLVFESLVDQLLKSHIIYVDSDKCQKFCKETKIYIYFTNVQNEFKNCIYDSLLHISAFVWGN